MSFSTNPILIHLQYISWALSSWFNMQLGNSLISVSMNCKSSTSPISLLLFQASHWLQWLQNIVRSKVFPIFLAIAAMLPMVHVNFYDHRTALDKQLVLHFLQGADFPAVISHWKKTNVVHWQFKKDLVMPDFSAQQNNFLSVVHNVVAKTLFILILLLSFLLVLKCRGTYLW